MGLDLYQCNKFGRTCSIQPNDRIVDEAGTRMLSCTGCRFKIEGPPIDVVVTCHNYERFLDECLESIHGAASVIVVDDSSDNAAEVERIAIANSAVYLQVDLHSPHLARGAGFKLCKSPLVCFLDADNTHQPGYLNEAAKLFDANPRLAIVYADLAYFGDESNTANDTMLALGTACNNAKKNVAAACEGKAEADQVYQFDDKKK